MSSGPPQLSTTMNPQDIPEGAELITACTPLRSAPFTHPEKPLFGLARVTAALSRENVAASLTAAQKQEVQQAEKSARDHQKERGNALEMAAALQEAAKRGSWFHESIRQDRLDSGDFGYYLTNSLLPDLETVEKEIASRSNARLRGRKEALEYAIVAFKLIGDSGDPGLQARRTLNALKTLRDGAAGRAKKSDAKALGEFDIYYKIVKFMEP